MTLPRRITRALAGIAAIAATGALAAGTALAADHDVGIAGLDFEPADITIAVGDTVVWTVTEGIGSPHSVTSGGPGDPDEGEAFDSGIEGLTNDGDTYEFTFETAGAFPYYCVVHGASMSGTVTVQEAGGAESPAASPAPAESPAASAAASPGESTGPLGSARPAGPTPGASPGAEPVPHEILPPVPPERKALAAGILGVAIVLMFGAAALWRRMNPA